MTGSSIAAQAVESADSSSAMATSRCDCLASSGSSGSCGGWSMMPTTSMFDAPSNSTKRMSSSARRASFGAEPDGHLDPVDAHLRQQPAQVLERQRRVAVGQRPAEFAAPRHRQRRHDGEVNRCGSTARARRRYDPRRLRAEHPHDDAVVAVVGNFRMPLARAFVSVGAAIDAVGDVAGAARHSSTMSRPLSGLSSCCSSLPKESSS